MSISIFKDSASTNGKASVCNIIKVVVIEVTKKIKGPRDFYFLKSKFVKGLQQVWVSGVNNPTTSFL